MTRKMSDNAISFFKTIEKFGRFTNSEKEFISNSFNTVSLKKGSHYLENGKVCSSIGFVIRGILRIYYTNPDGEEITRYFVKENQFAVNLESFNQRLASKENIQAVTPCLLISITYNDFEKLKTRITGWEKITQKVIESSLLEKLRLRNPMIIENAKTRYENFMKEQSEIAQRVPLIYIASYLGITPQSLSRIRKSIARNSVHKK